MIPPISTMRSGLPVVVFDLDDTLCAEMDFVHSAFRALSQDLAQAHGIDVQRCEQAFLSARARMPRRVFDGVLDHLGLPVTAEAIAELVQAYRAHKPLALRPYAGAARAVEDLRGHAHLAIITDGWEATQRAKLRAIGWPDVFDPIVCTFERGPEWHKPSPKGFDEIAARFPDAPWFAYIGDNPSKDFRAPAALGWRTVYVRRPKGVHHNQPDAGDRIDVRLSDLSDLAWHLAVPKAQG